MSKPGISLKGETYARMRTFCQAHGYSLSAFTEHLAIEFLRTQGEATPVDPLPQLSNSAPEPDEEERGVVVIETDPRKVKW